MTRSFEHFEAHARKMKAVTIFHLDEVVLGLGTGAEVNCGAATIAKFQMTGYEVSVEMREKDVPDLEAEVPGIGKVVLNITLRIDDGSRCTGLVSQQVRSVRKAAKVVLLENHRASVCKSV